MRRSVKRESEATRNGGGRRDSGDSEQFRSVKKEKNKNVAGRPNEPHLSQEEEKEGIYDPRVLRSQYLALMNKISDSKDDLTRVDYDTFSRIFSEFENLQQQVSGFAHGSLEIPDGWKVEQRIGCYGRNRYTIYVNVSSGFKTNLKHEVFQYQNTSESESEPEVSLEKVEETGTDYITYVYDTDEEDWSENEFVEAKGSRENVEDSSNVASTLLRSQLESMQKLESRAKTQCVFEDEDMSSYSDKKLPEAEEGCNEANALKEARVVESEKSLPDVDKAREIPGLTGSFSIEINLECEYKCDRRNQNKKH